MTGDRPRLILGSSSPRRQELLLQIGVTPDEVRPADINETPLKSELPRDYCRRVTLCKAEATTRLPGEIVLTADTTVAMGRRILGKPADEKEAAEFLLALAGRRHQVITAIAVLSDRGARVRNVVSVVKIKRLSDVELNAYLASGDWRGEGGCLRNSGSGGNVYPVDTRLVLSDHGIACCRSRGTSC